MEKLQSLEPRLGLLNLLIIVLFIYVPGALIVETVFKLPLEISQILSLLDNAICIFFQADFIYRFYQAEDKLKIMRWGWIDLIPSFLPVDFLRACRAIRLIRLVRILGPIRLPY
jgi:voltage-gated potassium channel